jgi:hypothetical protein
MCIDNVDDSLFCVLLCAQCRFLMQANNPAVLSGIITMTQLVNEIRDDFDVDHDGVISKLGETITIVHREPLIPRVEDLT